jgi:hypothetical protein
MVILRFCVFFSFIWCFYDIKKAEIKGRNLRSLLGNEIYTLSDTGFFNIFFLLHFR